MPRVKTPTKLSVRLTLDDREVAGLFRECTGLDSETEVTEHKSVDASGHVVTQKVPGPTRLSNITLRRGLDADTSLWDWRDRAQREGADAARTDGTIELVDYEGTPIATYRFEQGWPVRYAVAVEASTKNEIAIETIEICVESIDRV